MFRFFSYGNKKFIYIAPTFFDQFKLNKTMKKIVLTIGFILTAYCAQSQILVNGVDVTTTAKTFDVWAFTKPFSTKESYFLDYGQEKFKSVNYDTKAQCINDKDGKKFEKGEWIKLVNYLESQGYEEKTSRDANIGDAKGRVVTFVKKKE